MKSLLLRESVESKISLDALRAGRPCVQQMEIDSDKRPVHKSGNLESWKKKKKCGK